jgi:anti-anti-sigma factor
MQVKIDTKEIFHIIRLKEPHLTAIMTEDLNTQLLRIPESEIKNVVLNIEDTKSMEDAAAEKLVTIQQQFYEKNASFVICGINDEIEQMLDRSGLLEMMNTTPSESEAYDIVQMEEIERELLNEEDNSLGEDGHRLHTE